MDDRTNSPAGRSPLDRLIRFCLERKIIVILGVVFVIAWGVMVETVIAYLPK